MRAPRWALALSAIATVGTGALITLPAGTASADAAAATAGSSTYALTAQGDAQYYEVNSESIPASPNNAASSLVASAKLANGSGDAYASSPYYGTTVQNLPGTANGVPPGLGAPGVAFPFTRLPGYIECRSPDKATDDGGWYRTAVDCGDTAVKAHGEQGAPAQIPAPNQQETADAVVNVAGNTATAEASGTAAGFVQGPLEVGYAVAQAKIVDSVAKGKAPTITSNTFGRFSVNGQDFGFNQNGFRYLGQGSDSTDAIAQANEALKNAGIALGLAPAETTTDDATGATIYTIGGLKVTTTQAVPGAEPLTITFILGRASVSSLNDAIDFGTANSTGNSTGNSTAGSVDAGISGSTDPAAAPLDSAAAPAVDLGTGAAGALPAVDTGLTALPTTITDVAGPVVAGEQLPTSLGFAPVAAQRGQGTEWMYAMLLLGGIAVLGGHFLFGRFAVARQGA